MTPSSELRAIDPRADGRRQDRSDFRRAIIESAVAATAVAGIVALALLGLWRTSEDTLVREMRDGLTQLAGVAASTIDPTLHRQLRDSSQIDSPLYDKAIEGLRRALRMTPDAKYMYTVVRDNGAIRFVLDAAEPGDHDGDGREDRAQLWELYATPDSELLIALGLPGEQGRPSASEVPHTDEWGTFMTGYAPIIDDSGAQVGVVGVDVTADEYFSQLGAIRGQLYLGLIPSTMLTIAVGLGAFLLRRRHLASLRAAEHGECIAKESAGRLAESERRFRTLADSAPMLIWSADAQGHCDFVNKAWRDFTGRAADTDMGHGWLECVHPDDRDRIAVEFGAAIREQRHFLAEYRIRRCDGAYRLILDQGAPRQENGAMAGFIGAAMDITDRRQSETEMKRAFDAAQAADRAKSEFLANMSHEIRTPLTTILGYSEILRTEGDAERAPPPRLQAIRAIQSAGEHLLTITNDVLDLSKIEAGCMRVERVETELPPVLFACLDLLRFRAREKGLALRLIFDTPIPSRVITDPTRLRQILLNLLANAVKFTPSGSISVRCAAEHDALSIMVEDTGIGLSEEQSARLFRPFTQADATVTRMHGGTGLGLAICRRLAMLMGGNVTLARSESGVGSCFVLRVIASPAPDSVMLDEPPPEAPLTLSGVASGNGTGALSASTGSVESRLPEPARLAGRILLVEDGPDNRRLIALHLEHAGADVTTAENGVEALRCVDAAAARHEHFDLIVTDMQMPEMDGVTLARTLRERGETTPIIALTAHTVSEDRDRCLEAGCNDFATKPIDRASLIRVCGAWMSGVAAH